MPRGKTAKSLALIDACHDILEAIQPATVRAVCYQLFVRGLLPSMGKTHTNRVSAQLVYARKAGVVPWAWIVDETRAAERPGTWANPDEYIAFMLRAYRRDYWQHQSQLVEVWSEKGTVRGTLGPTLDELGVTFRVMHGHTSWTEIYEVAQLCRSESRTLTAFYVGDYDPSGMHMSVEDLPGRLAEMGVQVRVERLAVHKDDAQRQQLPSFPASDKKSDTRYPWFVRAYGEQCWELDAVSPPVLRDLVEEAIWALIDQDVWGRCMAVEAAEQRSMRSVLETWHAAKSGQATL